MISFDNDEDLIRQANETIYGLSAGIWTRDITRAHRFARAIKARVVWINTYKRVSPASPFGGVGQSGYGRDLGPESMHEYTFAKSVVMNIDAGSPRSACGRRSIRR